MKRRRFNQKLHLHYQETLTTRFQCCARKIYRKGELLGTRAFARAYLRSAERKNNLQIATEIKFLWNNNGLHRDIKLSNLFLSADMTVKKEISGWSILLPLKENPCGTANFICPEVLNGQGYSVGSELWLERLHSHQTAPPSALFQKPNGTWSGGSQGRQTL